MTECVQKMLKIKDKRTARKGINFPGKCIDYFSYCKHRVKRWKHLFARKQSKNSWKPRTDLFVPTILNQHYKTVPWHNEQNVSLRPYLGPISLISPFMSLVSILMVSHFNKPNPAIWLHGRIVSVSVRQWVFLGSAPFVGVSDRLLSNLLGIFQHAALSDWQGDCINLLQTWHHLSVSWQVPFFRSPSVTLWSLLCVIFIFPKTHFSNFKPETGVEYNVCVFFFSIFVPEAVPFRVFPFSISDLPDF